MKLSFLYLFAAVLLFLPAPVWGAVIINEIAWMGTAVSPNDEWIELYNTGNGTVSLAGWTLTDGLDLSIALDGALGAGQYGVLERTDDTSAEGTALLIYTGALANTGATLTLRDGNGTIVDQVAGGENWEAVGGDNVTKDTAQYTGGGWITAVPTPGTANATTPSVSTPASAPKTPSRPSGTAASSKKVVTAEQSKVLVPSTNPLLLEIKMPAAVYVNQPVTFEALSSNIGETIINSLQYHWNFGDLATATGKTTTHTYQYPGEYILTLRATYARHDEVYQTNITVLPVRFSLTQNTVGDTQIHNHSPYEVDISGFSISGDQSVTFPPLSFIPQNGTITIPRERIGTPAHAQIQLHDRESTLLALLNEQSLPAEPVPAVPTRQLADTALVTPVTQSPSSLAATAQFSFAPRPEVAETAATGTESVVSTTSTTMTASPITIATPTATATATTTPITHDSVTAASINAGTTLPANTWPLVGLASLIVLGLVGVYANTQNNKY